MNVHGTFTRRLAQPPALILAAALVLAVAAWPAAAADTPTANGANFTFDVSDCWANGDKFTFDTDNAYDDYRSKLLYRGACNRHSPGWFQAFDIE